MVINEGQEDRLHRIVHDVLRLEYPLNQRHVPLGPVLLPLRDEAVDVGYVSVVLGEQDLPLDGPEPLVQIVLRLRGQHVLPVLILDLQAVLLTLEGALVDHLDGGVGEHDEVEVLVFY